MGSSMPCETSPRRSLRSANRVRSSASAQNPRARGTSSISSLARCELDSSWAGGRACRWPKDSNGPSTGIAHADNERDAAFASSSDISERDHGEEVRHDPADRPTEGSIWQLRAKHVERWRQRDENESRELKQCPVAANADDEERIPE